MFYEAPSDYRGEGERATQSPMETIRELHALKREHPGKTSFSDEITRAYINKKKRRGQVGGALLGGALGTGAGAVLGSRLIPNKGIRMATGGVLGAGLGGYAGGRIERGRAHENVLHASNTQRKAVADLLSRLATAEGKSYTVSNADGSKSMRFNSQNVRASTKQDEKSKGQRKTAMFYETLMEKKAKRSKKSYDMELAILDRRSKGLQARGGIGGLLLGKIGIKTTNPHAEAIQRRKAKLLKERNRMYGTKTATAYGAHRHYNQRKD